MGEAPADDPATLARLVTRLEAAAQRLRAGELSPAAAAEEVEGCAQAAAHASAELERLARAAASESPGPPTQDRLV